VGRPTGHAAEPSQATERAAAHRSLAGERVGIAIVGSTATAVALAVTVAGFATSALWMFQLLAATGVLVGVVVALGALDPPSRWRRPRHLPVASPELADDVRRRLEELDPVEHRQLDLGRPWPTVVVGPTGIAVVAVADLADAATVRRLRTLVEEVRGLVEVPDAPTIPTVGVLVRPGATPARDPEATVLEVAPGELVATLARGPLLPMTAVVWAFTTLAGDLAPDLRLVS
jgi:hypothetical protein